ncbi:MAG: SpoVG family protein [Lachnospiraceae bacterium]|nr:SpoVG family protein [Lachnospiraceae bacterium]
MYIFNYNFIREELYSNILEAFANLEKQQEEVNEQNKNIEAPSFSVTVTPFEREGSNIRGLARIYFEDSFIVNNVNILQGKDKVFVAMPSYKTKQVDENGKAVYQDVCYPVTKDFREKLYEEIINVYEQEKQKQKNEAQDKAIERHKSEDSRQSQGTGFYEVGKKDTPFR